MSRIFFMSSRESRTSSLHEPIILIKMFMFALRVVDDEPNDDELFVQRCRLSERRFT